MRRKKNKKLKSFDYSPRALRKLVRHKFAKAVVAFKDRKKTANKKKCRKDREED